MRRMGRCVVRLVHWFSSLGGRAGSLLVLREGMVGDNAPASAEDKSRAKKRPVKVPNMHRWRRNL